MARSFQNTFDEYEQDVMSLAFYPSVGNKNAIALSYTALGLNGEAAEVVEQASPDLSTKGLTISCGKAAEQVKKALRDDNGVLTPERKEALKKELGDTLWYLTALAREAGFSLREIAEGNIEKLFDRAKRGTLQGSGDNR